MKRYLIIALSLLGLLALTACGPKKYYLGYVEGRLTYISSPLSGKLITLSVGRGYPVAIDDPLFELEQQPEVSSLDAALATVDQLTAQVADAMTGERPSELAAITAQIDGAQAQVEYAKEDLSRKKTLFKKKVVEQNQLDLAIENFEEATAKLNQYQSNLTTAKLGAREDQIKAVQAELNAARANLAAAKWSLSQKTVAAPVAAEVFDTYYKVGEQVPANQPVLSILVPSEIKVVFFVDEPSLSQIKVGQRVHIDCDHCASDITATIYFISPSAEYTPPVIYSRSARSKLVYEVEAHFDEADSKKIVLNPGQPVEVRR